MEPAGGLFLMREVPFDAQVATLRGLATEPLVHAFHALEPQLQVHSQTLYQNRLDGP